MAPVDNGATHGPRLALRSRSVEGDRLDYDYHDKLFRGGPKAGAQKVFPT